MNSKFDSIVQNKFSEVFHALHHADEMLVLLNVWDCASAKIAEMAGFPAIATTSAGVAWSYGYQDGEDIPPGLMVEAVNRIAHSVQVPVTADVEGGYFRNNLDTFSKFINNIIDAGAVGINLEDGYAHTNKLNDIKQQAAEIKIAKENGRQKGINLFVNARTDAMLLPKDLKSRIEICIERAKMLEAAGADGIFIPFIKEIETVVQLKESIRLPLNILMADTLDAAELRKLKINRMSVGSKPVLATLSLLRDIAGALRQGNNWQLLYSKKPTYGEVNEWFSKQK